MANYGLVTTGFTEKLAYSDIARWNDNIRRHTIYTVSDSLQDIWGGSKTATVPFDAVVGSQVSQQLFNWVPISWPGSYLAVTPQLADTWNPRNLSLAQMVTWGGTDLKSRIEATPGTFALVGYGIGGMVCSATLQEMQTPGTSLYARMSDCIGAVMFGNGAREEGVTYPGGTDPGGAGILPFATTGVKGMIRNTNTPDWWWEMATVDDPAATCPINTTGQAVNVAAEALLNQTNSRDFMLQIAKVIGVLNKSNSVWSSVAGRLTNKSAVALALNWAERVFALNPSPHNLYSISTLPSLPTNVPGMSGTSTYLDAAIAYLNLRGTTIPPR